MAEDGIDISAARPKLLDGRSAARADNIITMGRDVQGVPRIDDDWGIRDRFKETKTGKTRTNALDQDTVPALRRHRAKQNERRLLMGPAYRHHDLLFPRADGSPWDPDNFGSAFERLVRRANVPRVRLHDLRHTSAAILLRQGVASKVVSERLGHSTTALTTDTYQHVIAGMDEEAAAKAGQARREARARLAGT